MQSSFTFDGKELVIYLKVEGETEEAVAKLMEKFTRAEVHLKYPDSYYRSQEKPSCICFTLSEPIAPVPEFAE